MATYNKSQIFKNAWALVKSTGKKLSEALKAAWAKAKNTTTMTDTEKKISIAKERIELGAKFNGTIYTKFNGKNWITFSIYLDGAYFRICEVQKTQLNETKAQIESELCTKPALPKNEWLVNGKKVQNNLSYGEMWNMYGTDFE